MDLTFDGILVSQRTGVSKDGRPWCIMTFLQIRPKRILFSLFSEVTAQEPLPLSPYRFILSVEPSGRSFVIKSLSSESL